MKVSKNQGGCGSCWAFSTIGSIEARSEKAGKGYIPLSEQQLVDCVTTSKGCRGGNVGGALVYSQQAGNCGESDYVYTHTDGTCKDKRYPIRNHHVAGKKPVRGSAALKQELVNGPVSVAIEADQPVFQHYKSGVIKPSDCGKKIDHAVVAIGYGTESGQDYFLIRNSWGPNWGNNGTVKLGYTSSECACACDRYPVAAIIQ